MNPLQQSLRGDCTFGNERDMTAVEERDLKYLFKLRHTRGVKEFIEQLFKGRPWSDAGQGWEGEESQLRLDGWIRARRVIVLRRRIRFTRVLPNDPLRLTQTEFPYVEVYSPSELYEYTVLVTSLADLVITVAQHYRDHADAENSYDELENQWGWGGYTARDQYCYQVMARIAALIYNWWSIYAGLVMIEQHTEAITSRPLLLYAFVRQVRNAGQTLVSLTLIHVQEKKVIRWLQPVAIFLQSLRATAQ